MEDENFLEKTTSTDTEGDTTTMIIFQNNVQYNITIQNVVTACLTAAVLTSPGGDTGGERVSLISGWTGADSPVIHHLSIMT